LTVIIDNFMQVVARVCRRPDCAVLADALNSPNLHRVREVWEVLASSAGHVRHFWELWLEGIYQPTKKAIKQGNGRDDAGRAVGRMLESEFISRLALDLELWSGAVRGWTVHGGLIDAAVALEAARRLARFFVPAGSRTAWHSRASRGRGDVLYVGGAVAVLMLGADRGTCVNVADHRPDNASASAFYRVAAVFRGRHEVPCAIVQPYQRAARGDGYKLLSTRMLFLKLHATLRRALAMHRCDSDCIVSMAGVAHGGRNTWTLLGRRQGIPGRSA